MLRLGYLKGTSISLKSSCLTLLKNTSKLRCPVGSLWFRSRNACISLNLSKGSFWKWHFICIRLQDSWKYCLNSGLLTFLCIHTKSNIFSKTLISFSERTLLLKLNLMSEQKQPLILDSSDETGLSLSCDSF